MKIKDRILNIYTQFSPAERRVADYILEKPDDVIHYSITEFAKIVGVSETTIHRVIKNSISTAIRPSRSPWQES